MEYIQELWQIIVQYWDMMTHLDLYLNQWIAAMGPWIYVALFLVIFCETGLVVTPFLPGDSLLFVLGALAASQGAVLEISILAPLLIIAAILGDGVNYAIGHYVGPKVFKQKDSWLLNQNHLKKAQDFYEKHGGKTIVIARFAPIIRTFAPFVAGIGKMKYRQFAIYNVTGALLWILSFLFLGYYFGNLPAVKKNFQLVVFGIIILSVTPMVYEFLKAKFSNNLKPRTNGSGS